MSSAYFSLILREWGTAPEKHAALLDGIEVPTETPSQPAEITLGQQLRQVRNACRLLEPDWALALGSRLHPAAHGALGVGAASAPTMRDALFVMTRFSQLRAPHFRLRAVAAGEEVRLVPEDRVALLNAEHSALLDIVMLSTQGMIEAVLGRPMEEGRFEVPHAPPPHAELYERLFHAKVHFGCREAAIVIPAAWASLECPLADTALYRAALHSLHAGVQRLQASQLLVARVEQLLARRGARLGLGSAARVLGLSSRTLTRRLREEGTSYLTLVEQSQRARAESLLRDPELTVAEIAHALGYEDTANFGRAFRRWFGQSPGRYRRGLDVDPESALHPGGRRSS